MSEAKNHECPYGGLELAGALYGEPEWNRCGDDGWLCDRCKQDRADARNKALIDELMHLGSAMVDAIKALGGPKIINVPAPGISISRAADLAERLTADRDAGAFTDAPHEEDA